MKPILKAKKIYGVWCIFYANKAGCMWFGEINGQPYGAHEIFENVTDFQGHIDNMIENARESLSIVKNKLTLHK